MLKSLAAKRKIDWSKIDADKFSNNPEYRDLVTRMGQLEACDLWIDDPYEREREKNELRESWKITQLPNRSIEDIRAGMCEAILRIGKFMSLEKKEEKK